MSTLFEDSDDEETDSTEHWYEKPLIWVRIFYSLLIIGIVIIGITLHNEIWEFLIVYLEWLSNHMIIGSLVYVALHTVWVSIALPGTYLTLGAGFIYAHLFSFWEGVAISTLLSLIGTLNGSIIAFLNGRYVLRNCISSSFGNNNKWQIIEHMAELHGIKLVILLRFTFLPSSIVNYGTSITKIKFLYFLIGNIAYIPDIFIHSFIGAEFNQINDLWKGKITKEEMPLFIGSMVFMFICLLLIIALIYYAKKQVTKMTEEQQMIDNETILDGLDVTMVDENGKNIGQETMNIMKKRDSHSGITNITPFNVKMNHKRIDPTEEAPLLL